MAETVVRRRLEAVLATDAWVIEWQYTATRTVIAQRADTLIWLDLPFPIVLARLIRRTVMRRLRGEVLWNGNREAPLHTFFTDRDHIVRWGIRTRRKLHRSIPELEATFQALRIVHLRTVREADTWLASLLDVRGGQR